MLSSARSIYYSGCFDYLQVFGISSLFWRSSLTNFGMPCSRQFCSCKVLTSRGYGGAGCFECTGRESWWTCHFSGNRTAFLWRIWRSEGRFEEPSSFSLLETLRLAVQRMCWSLQGWCLRVYCPFRYFESVYIFQRQFWPDLF